MNDVLLVCDLDGTLLDSSGQIDQLSLKKIKKFCEDGGHFVICTGRMDTDIQYVEQKLGFAGEYRISQNGAVIKDKHNQSILLETIPSEYIPKLNQAIFAGGLRTEVSDENNRHFPSPRKPEEVAEFVDSSKVIEDLPAYISAGEISPTIYLTFGNEKAFLPIKSAITESLGADKVTVIQTSPSSLEVFSNKVSKGKAVELIQQKLGISSNNLYVVGDAESDVSMFTLTNHSYAVQEAEKAICEKANCYQKTVGDVVADIYYHKKEERI
ncbi:Cof-type HAD-IIB family hydrolase [Listeria welshimeri]|uniref:Cof-type HAD-IIB family hydrolase n=1 Tax=Listeria farberi TaxID=2713500 RepID=A0A7X0ZJ00_9LIST|nr:MULTISPECIES: Cof-type HAD-IIB family hydrolase [Listeria]MBC1340260.1 Cof-type HAD-IIB family hydrolase [Listeria welshimeri]MBC1342950.1 Cof-type HAD-IIB family hydrolase [Listeria welshimeri]MBC1347131.1 Cof-type HAD-IIB family hydrolase [Listeria welshimeri]MBC1362016.1 Cof-type HAD-IIB family hydrolase [Listeria welshimeri]MBC1365052.1 Cof-type HAD-IIB family hydrolase [Listeria welshimeri]